LAYAEVRILVATLLNRYSLVLARGDVGDGAEGPKKVEGIVMVSLRPDSPALLFNARL
jgi:hypothetical protein